MDSIERRAMNIMYPNTPYIEVLAKAQLISLKERCELCEYLLTQIEQPEQKTAQGTSKRKYYNTCTMSYSIFFIQSKNQLDKEMFHYLVYVQ